MLPDGRMRWLPPVAAWNLAYWPTHYFARYLARQYRAQTGRGIGTRSDRRLIRARAQGDATLSRSARRLAPEIRLTCLEFEIFGRSLPAERANQRPMAGILGTGEEIVIGGAPDFARAASSAFRCS